MRNSLSIIKPSLKKEEIEKRILERFPSLNDPQNYHNLFCSYDFHENERNLLEFWKDVLEFLYESVKECHGMKVEDIFDFIKIKGKKPLCLSNIVQALISEGELIPTSQLTQEDYYRKHFSDVIQLKESWGSWLKKGITRYMFKEKLYVPKNNELLLNKKMFFDYNDRIIKLMENLNQDEDQEVFTFPELKQLLRKNGIDDTLVEHSLTFLEKLHRVGKFTVKMEGTEVTCFKYFKDENSTVTIKDTAIVNLDLSIKKLDRSLNEMQHRIQESKQKAKEALLKKEKQQASNILKKKLIFQKTYDYYYNMKLTLEQNLIDIKSMESNQNIHNVMAQSLKATQALKLNVEDFENVTDKVKDNLENLKEVNFVIGDFNSEAMNDEELEKELAQLQTNENKTKPVVIEDENKIPMIEKSSLSKMFPAVGNKEVIIRREANDEGRAKDNFINENSFQEILEELNKR